MLGSHKMVYFNTRYAIMQVVRVPSSGTRLLQLRSGRRRSSLFRFLIVINVLSHLPHLHDVVLGHGTHNPRLVVVPRKVGYFGRVAAVHKQKLGGTVLGVFRALFLPDLAKVPHVEPSIRSAGGQDCFVMRRPLDLRQDINK